MVLHKKYGHGLKNIFDPFTGEVNHKELHRHSKLAAVETEITPFGSYPAIVVNGEQVRAFFLGLVYGNQYKKTEPSKCFYSVLATVDSTDYFVQDFYDLLRYFEYYNLFIYDPVQFYGNLLATYE